MILPKITVNSSCRQWPLYCREVCWTKMVQTTILVKMTLFRTGLWHSQDQNGPKWSILVHFGLKRTILVHSGPPTVHWPFLIERAVNVLRVRLPGATIRATKLSKSARGAQSLQNLTFAPVKTTFGRAVFATTGAHAAWPSTSIKSVLVKFS